MSRKYIRLALPAALALAAASAAAQEKFTYLTNWYAQAEEGLNIKHDISVPVSRIPAFVAETDALLAREVPGVRLVDFGHLGDGNLHYNVQAPEGADGQAFLRDQEDRINTLVFDAVARHAGSISAEHGIGSLKAAKLPHYKPAVALELMRAIKGAVDPQGIMNPGRVLG